MTERITQPTRTLGHTNVSLPVVGLGCMGMSEFYGAVDEAQSLATLRYSLDVGVTHWDTSDIYGPHTNERLLAKVLVDRRDEVFLASKFGILRDEQGQFLGVNGRPEYVRSACEASLKRLGVERIDLYYQHRPDPSVPVTDTVGELARLVAEGKIGHIGLSECSEDRLRAAHGEHPIASHQGEYSIWTRVHEGGVLDACRELGITYVAYSPLGRGFLTGSMERLEDLAADDWRRKNPRFSPENWEKNRALVESVKAIALARGCTPAQIALAWVIARNPQVVAIPGTTKQHRVAENAAAGAMELTREELAQLTALPTGAGERY